jgi:tRNA G18 (ribose-2'-O)-methylase SpoU
VAAVAVHDLDDPRLADYRNIPDRELLRDRGIFVAEGRLVVRRLLIGSRFAARSVLVTPAAYGALADALAGSEVPVYVAAQELLNGITGINLHRGCLAIGERGAGLASETLLASASRLIVLEQVANADNVGAIFRNAAAFGADGVMLDPTSVDPLYRKAIRTSMGTALSMPFARGELWPEALQQLRESGLALIGLTARAPRIIAEVAARTRGHRIALLLGGEGEGLSQAALDACDERARVPMAPGVDSLNVATAGAVALYELFRKV